MSQNSKWCVLVRVEPHFSWEFQVRSFEEALPTINELLCHARYCGGRMHSVEISFTAPSSQGWIENGGHVDLGPIPSPPSQHDTQRQVVPLGTHMVIVPVSKPHLVPDSYVIETALNRFAELHWVVVSAFCALLAGIFNVFLFASWTENSNGRVMHSHPISTIFFVALALVCVTLVLHRVNRYLAQIAMRQLDPLLILFLVVRQWASLTYNNVSVLGSWNSWSDDMGRLVIDLIFYVCIVACDAWHVRTIFKWLFLACCLTWSLVKLFNGWGNNHSAKFVDMLLGESCYSSSWIAIVLFILKALLCLMQGNDFVFCNGKLEIRRAGKSRPKLWHSSTFTTCVRSCCHVHAKVHSAGLEYLQVGPEILEINPECPARAPQRHDSGGAPVCGLVSDFSQGTCPGH